MPCPGVLARSVCIHIHPAALPRSGWPAATPAGTAARPGHGWCGSGPAHTARRPLHARAGVRWVGWARGKASGLPAGRSCRSLPVPLHDQTCIQGHKGERRSSSVSSSSPRRKKAVVYKLIAEGDWPASDGAHRSRGWGWCRPGRRAGTQTSLCGSCPRCRGGSLPGLQAQKGTSSKPAGDGNSCGAAPPLGARPESRGRAGAKEGRQSCAQQQKREVKPGAGWGRERRASRIRCARGAPAVAENLAQLVAFFSHSRFSRRKASTVVPQCMSELANTVAEWHTLRARGASGRHSA